MRVRLDSATPRHLSLALAQRCGLSHACAARHRLLGSSASTAASAWLPAEPRHALARRLEPGPCRLGYGSGAGVYPRSTRKRTPSCAARAAPVSVFLPERRVCVPPAALEMRDGDKANYMGKGALPRTRPPRHSGARPPSVLCSAVHALTRASARLQAS